MASSCDRPSPSGSSSSTPTAGAPPTSHILSYPSATSSPPHGTKRPLATAKTSSRSGASYPRKRAVSACLVCRSRKTKCDNQRPRCGFCQQTGAECGYNESEKLATFDAASLAILDKLAHLEALIQGQKPPAQPHHHHHHHNSPSVIDEEDAHDLRSLDATPAPSLSSGDTLHLQVPLSLAMGSRVEETLQWPIFAGLVPGVDNIIAPLFAIPDDDDSANNGTDQLDPWRADIPALAQRFFRNVHTKNPILEFSLLENWVYQVSVGGFGHDAQSCLVLLVCALGALSAPYDPQSMSLNAPQQTTRYPSRTIAGNFFAAARRRLGIVLTSNSLTAVQCLFMAGIYYSYSMQQFAAWKMFNAASVAFMGHLRRSSSSSSPATPASPHTTGFEQRLYWSCLKSELELCQALNTLPSGLSQIPYPHAFPSPPRTLQPTSTADSDTTWFYYLAEIALRKLEAAIVTAFPPGPSPETTTTLHLPSLLATAREFTLQLSSWRDFLPPVLHFPSDPYAPCADERLQYLRARFWWTVSRVHRPFVYLAVHHAHSPAVQGEDVRAFVRDGLQAYCGFILATVVGHRHHGAWLGLRAGAGYALEMLAVAAAARDARSVLPERWREGVGFVKSCLRYWEGEVGDARGLREAVERVEVGLGFTQGVA
ncbi:hypothetical protein EDC01DRAFT_375061 [Geopyxis carbonaria]|nr:hypothetical protein EDC01DRAFT_375061 [Geopyxis carbonaria]